MTASPIREAADRLIAASAAPRQCEPIRDILGDNDIPSAYAVQNLLTADALAKADLPCQWHISFGVGHGIDEGGLMHGGLFIARNFGIKVKAAVPPPAPPRRR